MKAIRDASPQAGHVEMNTFIRSGDRSTRCLDLYLCIDGRRYFHDEGRGGKTKQIIFSVKAGKVTVAHIRDLVGVISRERAEIGAFLSLEPPTSPMRREAASAGFYESSWGKHPRIQLLTIEDLLGGKGIDYPQATDVTFKKAQRVRPNPSEKQKILPMEGETPEEDD